MDRLMIIRDLYAIADTLSDPESTVVRRNATAATQVNALIRALNEAELAERKHDTTK